MVIRVKNQFGSSIISVCGFLVPTAHQILEVVVGRRCSAAGAFVAFPFPLCRLLPVYLACQPLPFLDVELLFVFCLEAPRAVESCLAHLVEPVAVLDVALQAVSQRPAALVLEGEEGGRAAKAIRDLHRLRPEEIEAVHGLSGVFGVAGIDVRLNNGVAESSSLFSDFSFSFSL